MYRLAMAVLDETEEDLMQFVAEIWWKSSKNPELIIFHPKISGLPMFFERSKKVSFNWTIGARRQGPQDFLGDAPGATALVALVSPPQAAASCCDRRQW